MQGGIWEYVSKKFEKDEEILEIFFNRRLKDKPCPVCKEFTMFYKVKNRKCYECGECGYQVYPLRGTIMEGTKLPLRIWFRCIAQFSSSRNGVSAMEIQRMHGVSYKIAFRIAGSIRKLMAEDIKLKGIVRIDETWVGEKKQYYVLGMVEKSGRLKFEVLKNKKKKTIIPIILDTVEKGSEIHTDEHGTYQCLTELGYKHDTVKHKDWQWAKGLTSTNQIEGCFGNLKPSILGTHRSVSKKYLQDYLNEYSFRYNRRNSDGTIFLDMIENLMSA
jgi:transposase